MKKNLLPKQVIDRNGVARTVYVKPDGENRLNRPREPKIDVVEVGTYLDSAKSAVGKVIFGAKSKYVLDLLQAAVDDQASIVRESEPASDFDKGWLNAFIESKEIAENQAKKGVWFTGSKEQLLANFVDDRMTHYERVYQTGKTDYNDGAVTAFNRWYYP